MTEVEIRLEALKLAVNKRDMSDYAQFMPEPNWATLGRALVYAEFIGLGKTPEKPQSE